MVKVGTSDLPGLDRQEAIRWKCVHPTGDRLSLLSPPNVAAGAHDSLVAFLSGASLFPYDVRQEGPVKLAEFLELENITIYHSVPTVLRRLRQSLPAERQFPSVRVLALVGERALRSDVEIYRRYFPTTASSSTGTDAPKP